MRGIEGPALTQTFNETRKIDPTKGAIIGNNTPNDMDRVEIGPTKLAFDEWANAGLELPDLQQMRRFRHQRLVQGINARDYGALVVFDPLNNRHVTDSTNMQLWSSHNPFRALIVLADGYMVMWDYKNSPFLSQFNPLVNEQCSGADFFYFDRGDMAHLAAEKFNQEVLDLVHEHGGGNMRLAIDKIMMVGPRALGNMGFEVMEGKELTERARIIKGTDEIKAMRCAVHACETAVRVMEDAARSGVPSGQTSEDDIWAVLHAKKIRRGGE